MILINKENIISNKQIKKLIKLLGDDYSPKKIIVFETKFDVIIKSYQLDPIQMIMVLLGRIEGTYYGFRDKVYIYIFSENDDGNDIHSKQFYSLHVLLHELRHRWQRVNKSDMVGKDRENDADKFATDYLNNNSKIISDIMGWEDEWEIEEE